MIWGFLVPIINTIFIELSPTPYLMISFFAHLILKLNLLHCNAGARQIKSPQETFSFVQEDQTSPSNNHSSAHSLNGGAPVLKYLYNTYLIFLNSEK